MQQPAAPGGSIANLHQHEWLLWEHTFLVLRESHVCGCTRICGEMS